MPFLGPKWRDLPCTTLPRCRLRPRPRTHVDFVVVAAEGGWGEPAISFVCSCDSTSKRALEHARSGAADVLRLLLRQYVQESFGAPRGHGWSGADRRKGPVENECGSLAMAGSWGSS